MFLRTTIFQKRPKNPLTCSRKRKALKISPRHQSDALEPRGVRGIDVKVVSLDFTGFAGLHLIYLLDLKGQNAYTGTYRGGILGLSLSLKNWQV
jgi:hypothetical protein